MRLSRRRVRGTQQQQQQQCGKREQSGGRFNSLDAAAASLRCPAGSSSLRSFVAMGAIKASETPGTPGKPYEYPQVASLGGIAGINQRFPGVSRTSIKCYRALYWAGGRSSGRNPNPLNLFNTEPSSRSGCSSSRARGEGVKGRKGESSPTAMPAQGVIVMMKCDRYVWPYVLP